MIIRLDIYITNGKKKSELKNSSKETELSIGSQKPKDLLFVDDSVKTWDIFIL